MAMIDKLSNRTLYILFVVTFVVYYSTLHLRPYSLSYLVKIVPLVILVLISYKNTSGAIINLMVTALLFSAAGDIILALNGRSLFVYGLAAFLAAHCFYTFSFLFNGVSSNPKRFFNASIFVLYAVIIIIILGPNLKNMVLPVSIYILIITCMGVSAVIARESNKYMILGAVLFIISDSVIAFNMFHSRVPYSSYWIMISYFPAQFLIILGNVIRMNNGNALRSSIKS